MPIQTIILILLTGGMLLLIAAVTHFSGQGSLDNIKSKTVGDGQHGTARWADNKEIAQAYKRVPFHVGEWRSGKNLPKQQGLVLGCTGKKNSVTALVDTDDIHCLMIGASGVGKTAFFLYLNLEYACASGNMHCHHKTPYRKTKDDSYSNLVLVTTAVHRFLHATKPETVKAYMDVIRPDKKQIAKINRLRKMLDLCSI